MKVAEGTYAVIFTSVRHVNDGEYLSLNDELEKIAASLSDFIGIESARSEIGISVSYWKTKESIKEFKKLARHQLAQKLGREKWYEYYNVNVARIERSYGFERKD